MSIISLGESMWILAIFLLVQISFRIAFSIVPKGNSHTLVGPDMLRLIREALILLVFLYMLIVMGHIHFGGWSIDLKSFALYLIILLLLLAIENILLIQFTNSEKALVEAIKQYPVSQITSIMLLSPIVEEIIFRKVMIGILFSDHVIIGVFVSSLVFAILHFQFNLVDFLLIVMYGIILGFSYVTTQTIFLPILLHMIVNWIQLGLLRIGKNRTQFIKSE